MPHVIKWKIRNDELYTRPFIDKSHHQPLSKLLLLLSSWLLLCLSLNLMSYLITLQPYINAYFQAYNLNIEVTEKSLELTCRWVSTLFIPISMLFLRKSKISVRNSYLFFLAVLSFGLCLISSFYNTYGYFITVLGILSAIQASVIYLFPFVVIREVVPYWQKTMITGVFYGLFYFFDKLINWILLLCVDYNYESEVFKGSPFLKSIPSDAANRSIFAIRVIIIVNFVFAVVGFVLCAKNFGIEFLEKETFDGMIKSEVIENYRNFFN